MEDRESSVVSSVDFYGSDANATHAPAPAVPSDAPLPKRKADDAPAEPDKKRKLELDASSPPYDLPCCAGLPPELWQHVFSFCSLADLGRLIQVNRPFLSYLTDVRTASTSKSGHGRLHLLKSESLWASARNALCTKPPKPLPGFSELQMWQLAWSKRCQFCNKLDSYTPGERIWQKGPGNTGVRAIWPFAIRACGPCLLQQCQTDASLLFSTASAVRPALPFALLTNDQHYIAAYTLQSATTPADVEIAKYYYKNDVQDMTQELNEALGRGPAAAEEWAKGLEARGRERMKLAENWERWEVKNQWWEQHNEGKRAASAAPSQPATSHKRPSRSPPRRTPSPIIHAPIPATPSSQQGQARPPTVPPQAFTPSGQRNLHDANEAKATRKTDIERRCQQMEPPIAPNVLRHMDSFKAAIQIPQPMNDYAWSVLQPRLIAQLPAAQQAEADHVARAASHSSKAADRRHLDANSKEAREVMDREWEESQRPIRDRLDAIADEFINRDWDHGNAVTYENSPKFAADLLAYVRRTFYAERARSSTDHADSKPKLVLDNMKWVYDNKIKPLTEQFRKDIFLCHGQGCEHNNKYYGFEGVTQHYGAKHTSNFSSGNVVVAWREAEWPEETPFHPDPSSVKPLHAHHPSSGTNGNAIAPPPSMPPPGQGVPEIVPSGTEDTGQSTSSFDKQVSSVIEMTQDIWKRTSGVKDMPNSLRIYILLHRVISKFHVEFNHEPNLNHFIDALSNHEMPKALKNAPGLSCKACQVGSAHQPPGSFYSKAEERTTYTVLGLLSHFRTQHLPYQHSSFGHPVPGTALDWKENMIELPSERFISGLIHAPGMDDEKLLMIATVFPSLFPMPLPKIGVIDSHGLASPASSGPKDPEKAPGIVEVSLETAAPARAGPAGMIAADANVALPPKPLEAGYDPLRPGLNTEPQEVPGAMNRKRSYRDSPPSERRQHQYPEPRYYVGDLQHSKHVHATDFSVCQVARDHLDDGYHRPREYDYAPSPRIVHAGPAYDDYPGRRTAFREQERFYGPPDEIVYAHPREGSHGSREYSAYPRQVRYYEEEEHRPEYRFVNERRSRDDSPPRALSAAERFLAENEPPQPSLAQQPEAEPATPVQENENGSRYTPPPTDAPAPAEANAPIRPLGPPHPRAPSTVSNGSRFDDYQPNGHRMPMSGPGGPPRRSGPQRRRDRPHDQRGPSRYQRYMSVARDDPYGRGSSMSRSQSRRYEEQRRRIDQQETPQPNAEPDYEPDYSREHSADHSVQDDSFFPPPRRQPRGYVSVQDRLHPHTRAYSPPRYRYDEPRGPHYVDEYGHPIHEYEVIRVPRHRDPYMPHQPHRYEPEPYRYVQYERPPPQRYNSRHEEYMYYEERERPIPRRPAQDAESDVYEPPPPEIKVESVPVPMPPEAS
ncbi:conserved hypothetical protein [Pyrenophora tritici-repentis Pt-1C-BFP]|uniref:DUF7892 domain-containing protein n=1 Tax=Pyrenophora tritici-repentis (strain Pt-1C-BFP) TaxID=426418 RepID=B2WDL9_PYRTR|nr:uncharacterized protein PTRG_08078 [Pyrenophora tritici-repentis Pt-1C-BFP]EDU50997.1 conserved hypothetical protein [Pyrenophora tritici-repentis Pt-1C-BFP]